VESNLDVLVVGAGISGIGAGYHLRHARIEDGVIQFATAGAS
jgi:cation diffusion facilitator CzcD-associated flavoprotein CzcO